MEAQKYSSPRTWRVKQTTDKGKPSTNINVLFALPEESRAPSEYEQGKHKRLRSKIVKEGITIVDDGHQQLIQVVGSKDVS